VTETYFGDVIGSYANGVQLDLRVKLAVDFLKAPGPLLNTMPATPEEAAKQALDIADALIAEATKRGLVRSLPDTDELSAPMRKHIRRQVRAQIVGQVAGQTIMAEEQPSVMAGPVAVPTPLHPGRR
jgi:hypothetical protein